MSDSTTNLTVKEGGEPSGARLLPHPDSHNIIFFNGMDNQEVMRITPDGRLVKGPGLSDDAASLLFFDSCKKVFGNAADELRDLRAARVEADDLRKYLNEEISVNSELGDELLAERATFAEFKLKTWEGQRTLRAERDKLLGFYTEIVRELGDDLVLKRIRELTARAESAEAELSSIGCRAQKLSLQAFDAQVARAEAAEAEVERLKHGVKTCDGTMVVDGNDMYDWGWETPQSAQGRRDEAIATKLAGVHAAVVEACKNAQMKVLVWYPENTRSYIHPNQLTEIYKSQVTECLAAIEAVFEAGGQQQEGNPK